MHSVHSAYIIASHARMLVKFTIFILHQHWTVNFQVFLDINLNYNGENLVFVATQINVGIWSI